MDAKARKQRTTTFNRRRLRHFGLVLVALSALALVVAAQQSNLIRDSFTTGYVLIAALFFLAAFNLRKKITVLPTFGSSAAWMQVHIYVGFVSIGVFLMHIGWHIPNGAFERFLAALYLLVSGSGVYGLFITRTVPRQLTAIGNEVIFESIPSMRRRVAKQAYLSVYAPAEPSETLLRFYVNRLARFFEQPRSLAYLIRPSRREYRQLMAEMKGLDRYLSVDQRQASRQLASLLQEKDDLDYHYAMQGRLKLWLFVHIGMTYSLLIVAVLHGILVHSFSGAGS